MLYHDVKFIDNVSKGFKILFSNDVSGIKEAFKII